MARRFPFLSKKRTGGTSSSNLMSLAKGAGLGERAKKIEEETSSGEDVEKRWSGGRIRDLFDAIDIPQAQLIGLLKRMGLRLGTDKEDMSDTSIKESYEKKQSFMDFMPDTLLGKGAGLVGDIVLDPLNLVGVGMFGKVDDAVDALRGVAKFGDIASDVRKGKKVASTAEDVISGVRKSKKTASWAQDILEKGNVVARGTKITPGELALSGIKQVGQKAGKSIDVGALGKIPGVRKVKDIIGEKLVYQYQIPEGGRQLLDEADLAKRLGWKEGTDVGKRIDAIESGLKKRIGTKVMMKDVKGEVWRKPLAMLEKELSPDDFAVVKNSWNRLDELGKELVDLKQLPKDVYEANIGRYVRNYNMKYEFGKGAKGLGYPTKPMRANLNMSKARKNLSKEVRESLEMIDKGGYGVGKSIAQLSETVTNLKLFKGLSSKFAKDIVGEGFEQLPKVATLGDLSGKAIPKPFYNYIEEIIKPKTSWEKLSGKAVTGFKYGKVILNPATHARNILSNFILNSFEGMNFSNPKTYKAYAEAGKEMLKPGKYTELFEKLGGGLETFRATELGDILTGGIKTGSKGMRAGKKFLKKAGDMYQGEEKYAKMAQFIFQINRGVSPQEAVKAAEAATFNYAQITPFIRKMRQAVYGAPFITFTYKATPQVAKTLIKHPTKISLIGKIGRGAERFSPKEELAEEKANEPDYMKNGFFVKLMGKDNYGRSGYFDLSYIIPFGDLVSGDILDDPAQASPLLNIIKELSQNKTYTGQEIYKKSGTTYQKSAGISKYLAKTYLPTPLTSVAMGEENATPENNERLLGVIGGNLARSAQFGRAAGREPEEAKLRQTRDVGQELLRNVGIKIQPLSLEYQKKRKQREKIEALKQLLKDEGVTQELNIPYKPKKKKFNFL